MINVIHALLVSNTQALGEVHKTPALVITLNFTWITKVNL